MRTACDVLVTDSLADNEQLPTPDSHLTLDLSRAYGSAADAGRACFEGSGAGTQEPSADTERVRAVSELVVAEARYDSVISNLPGGTP